MEQEEIADEKRKGQCGEHCFYTYSDGVLEISGTGEMYDFYINDYMGQDGTVNPPAPWHDYKKEITSLIIQDGVTAIGTASFYDCYNLEAITLADSITSIGDYAFYEVDWEIAFPESLLYIGECAFQANNVIEELIVPEGVISIGYGAFRDCYNLTSVSIPSTVTYIGDAALSNATATSVLKEISVSPENENYFSDDGILYNLEPYELLQYPIGRYPSEYSVPDGVAAIGAEAFGHCSSLEKVTLPESLKEIRDGAFSVCSLSEIVIPNSVERIGVYAFNFNTSLKTVTVGSSVKYIGEGAFGYAGKSDWTSNTTYYFRGDCPIYVQPDLKRHYANGDQWSGSIFLIYGESLWYPTIYYPVDNATWTEESREQLCTSSNATYIPYQPEGLPAIYLLEGADGSYSLASENGYTLHISEELERFLSVTMDGQPVSEGSYTLESGSTILIFKPEYLKTLSTGVHEVQIVFTSGMIETTLTLYNEPSTDNDAVENNSISPSANNTEDNTASATGAGSSPFTLSEMLIIVIGAGILLRKKTM